MRPRIFAPILPLRPTDFLRPGKSHTNVSESRHVVAAIINLQFMLEMRKLEEDDECRFEEEYNVWLSDEPLTNDEICQLMREVERQRKQEGKPPLVQFFTSRKHSKKTRRENGAVNSSRKPNGAPTPDAIVNDRVPEATHE